MKRFIRIWLVSSIMAMLLASGGFVAPARADADAPATTQPARLQTGDRVAVIGDSITEQQKYSVFIEDYMLACQPALKVRVAQFGWSGERMTGLKARLDSSVLWFSPNVVTTCYGMNDGGYLAFNQAAADTYRTTNEQVIDQLQAAGVRFIVIGAPGCVDSDKFHRANAASAEEYNKTLAKLADVAKDVAQEKDVAFCDTHALMMDAMAKFKAANPGVAVAGTKDGIHPDDNGHLIMAYGFLKALGCDGNIGTITVDLANNKADATDGHKIISSSNGTIEIESTRMPFIVPGKAEDPLSARAMLPFIPFNQDLNRLMLIVTGAGHGKVKISWGDDEKQFDAAALAKGINLAAEFPDNPFSETFANIDKAVRAQQTFETPLTKDLMLHIGSYKKMLPEDADALAHITADAAKHDESLANAAAAAVTPVRHTIKIEVTK
jgi:lysophospholipase L1-like esterase